MTIENIMNRKSIRNYTGEPVHGAALEKLTAFINELNESAGIFGNKIRLQYIESNSDTGKLGTYGVIKGARSFFAAACKKNAYYYMEDVGYQFEKLVLFATGLGLATVILGGTFSRGSFSRAIGLKEDEILPLVSPVGYAGGKKSLLGRMIKSKSGDRKPWSELFFDGDLHTPLSESDEFAAVLEAVRRAPSAINAQPWRIVRDGGAGYHFYSAGKIEMNRADMGIALCHFEIAAAEKGFTGQFQVLEQNNVENAKYLISFVRG